ncbi:hypothetical protein Fmac_023043 [Flemingia macrophylla]|uniref:Uncharacterized protein n=1 Tax=Flemingia macrophylla TaxID=520843 RepID=A0ABD1LKE3_9FABA
MEFNDAEYVALGGEGSSPKLEKIQKFLVIVLMFLIFYEVSGGPFGVEDTVRAAGPFVALIGFLVFPLIWSVQEALMGTMNGGYVVWVSSALGSYWGFQPGWMKWLSGVIDNALYPARGKTGAILMCASSTADICGFGSCFFQGFHYKLLRCDHWACLEALLEIYGAEKLA